MNAMCDDINGRRMSPCIVKNELGLIWYNLKSRGLDLIKQAKKKDQKWARIKSSFKWAGYHLMQACVRISTTLHFPGPLYFSAQLPVKMVCFITYFYRLYSEPVLWFFKNIFELIWCKNKFLKIKNINLIYFQIKT
jgi:hypothetical protein